MRIDKLLSHLKYGSRSEIKDAVKAGLVQIDGVAVADAGLDVEPERVRVTFAGDPVFYRKWIYLMMNKPRGVVSANTDEIHPTAVALIHAPFDRFDLSICGRLDLDAEGLLLLTNDGDTLHRIISPKTDVYKTYEVVLRSPLAARAALERGVTILDGRDQPYTTKPARVEPTGENACRIAICEGKFHQVKRMFEAVGNEVLSLKRVAIGNLNLDSGLPPGAYRELAYEDILRVFE